MSQEKDTILLALYYSKEWLTTLLDAHYEVIGYDENIKKWRAELKKIRLLEKKLQSEEVPNEPRQGR
jgi:hypothetical protein